MIVADTSALVSLGCAIEPSVLDAVLAEYQVAVPEAVVAELEETAAYDDEQAQAASRFLDRRDEFSTVAVPLDSNFPLDDGENAAVELANDRDAAMLLCDEFNKIGLIHASLDDVKLVTTPKFLLVLETRGVLSTEEIPPLLDEIGDIRSWDGNSYVKRVRDRL